MLLVSNNLLEFLCLMHSLKMHRSPLRVERSKGYVRGEASSAEEENFEEVGKEMAKEEKLSESHGEERAERNTFILG